MTDDLHKDMRDEYDATDPGLGRSDEARRADDLAPTGQDAPAGAPTGRPEWSRQEWEGNNQPHGTKLDEESRATLEDAVTRAPKWNEHEVVGEGQGGPNEGPTERVIPTEGDNEFSGHGHNPGGGERWADVDTGVGVNDATVDEDVDSATDVSPRLDR